MNGKDRQRFKGWPKTTIDQANHKITVSPNYVDPNAVPLRNTLFVLGVIGIGILFLIYSDILKEGASSDTIYTTIFFVVVAAGVWIWLIDKFLKKTAHVEFSPEWITVKKGWGGGDKYERSFPHGFNMELHEGAETEFEEEQFEASKRAAQRQSPKRQTRIYRDSYHVFMDHVDGRVP